MTVIPFRSIVLSLWCGAKKSAKSVAQSDTYDNPWREYASEMLASDAVVGECGATALMTLFPKDF